MAMKMISKWNSDANKPENRQRNGENRLRLDYFSDETSLEPGLKMRCGHDEKVSCSVWELICHEWLTEARTHDL